MLDFQLLGMFSLASILLALSPGPDNLFVLTQSMAKGSKVGILITLGLCSGLVFHTLAVALGVAVIFQTSLFAFNALKIVGASYLMYLAYFAFKESGKTELKTKEVSLSWAKLYKRGLIMNITNPKVSIFFLAFLPHFVNPTMGNVTMQIVILCLVFMVCAFSVFSCIAFLAGRLGKWFFQTKYGESILNKLAGAVFVGIAIKLLLSERE